MYDVIIVGGGIAGSVLAEKLIKNDFNILVIERTKRLKKDSGIVANRNIGKVIPRGFIEHRINEMTLVSPFGLSAKIRTKNPFAYIIDRQKLNKYFLSKIAGLIVYDHIKDVVWEDGFVSVIGDNKTYYGKMIIGCDGANSIVRKKMNKHDGFYADSDIVFGALAFDKIKTDSIHVYFNKLFSTDFFAWKIPQNNEYGLMVGKRPMDFLNHFKKKFGYGLNDVLVYPMIIGCKKSYSDRCLLVGESAGQNKPITGGGIDLAIVSAYYAFTTVLAAFKNNNFSSKFLESYHNMWYKDFGSEINRQMFLRKVYMKLNNEQIDDLFKIVKDDLEKTDYIEDYIELSNLTRKLSYSRLFLWSLRNFGTIIK
ncbi:MAG: NAD(P)/FAD-dependent oxidoreductase [Candidatus Aenigmarchaeota archaeon]|nr:NAD(P)/FAD-dependent oxidoreductase [Candidatus Aenigmarchaeota archaeon]